MNATSRFFTANVINKKSAQFNISFYTRCSVSVQFYFIKLPVILCVLFKFDLIEFKFKELKVKTYLVLSDAAENLWQVLGFGLVLTKLELVVRTKKGHFALFLWGKIWKITNHKKYIQHSRLIFLKLCA